MYLGGNTIILRQLISIKRDRFGIVREMVATRAFTGSIKISCITFYDDAPDHTSQADEVDNRKKTWK